MSEHEASGFLSLRHRLDERRSAGFDLRDEIFERRGGHRACGFGLQRTAGRAKTANARRGTRPAKKIFFEHPHFGAEGSRLAARRRKRMLQAGKRGDGGEILGDHLRDKTEEGNGRRVSQGLAAGIVHLHVPPAKLHCDAAREFAIGRDEGRRLLRRFEHFAHHERDGARFVALARRFDHRQTREPFGGLLFQHSETGEPFLRRLGGTQRLGEEPRAGGGA